MSSCTTCSCTQFQPHTFKPQQCSSCFHSKSVHTANNNNININTSSSVTNNSKQATTPPPVPTHNTTHSTNIPTHGNGGTTHVSDKQAQQYKVLYDYNKEDDRQLTINENDILTAVPYNSSDAPDGWLYVQHDTTHEIGWVAECFVEPTHTDKPIDSSKNNSTDVIDSNQNTPVETKLHDTNDKTDTQADNTQNDTADETNDKSDESLLSKVTSTISNAVTSVLPTAITGADDTTNSTDTANNTTDKQIDTTTDMLSAAAIGATYGTDDIVHTDATESNDAVEQTHANNTTEPIQSSTTVPTPSQQSTTQQTTDNKRQVKTLYPFTATLPSQLSFQPNEVFTVTESQHPGWLCVMEHDNKIIPSNYVTEYDAVAEHEKQAKLKLFQHKLQAVQYAITHNEPVNNTRCVKALYKFDAQYKEQISIERNDVLYIIDMSNQHKGWLYAVKQADAQQTGLVPENYVEDYTPPKSTESVQPATVSSISTQPNTTPTVTTNNIANTTPTNKTANVTATTPISKQTTPRSGTRDDFDDMFAAPIQSTTPTNTQTTQQQQSKPVTPSNTATIQQQHTSQQAKPAPPPPQPQVQQAPSKPQKLYKALYKFDAQDTEQLSFNIGDILNILEITDDGWWLAKHTINNKTGYVPEPYLQVYQPPVSTPPSQQTTPIYSRQNSLLNYVSPLTPTQTNTNVQPTTTMTPVQSTTPPTRNVQTVDAYQAIVIRPYKAQYKDECDVTLGTLVKVTGLDTNTQMVRISDIINDVNGLVPLKHTARVLARVRTMADCFINPADPNAKQFLPYIRGDRIYKLGKKTDQLGIGYLAGRIGLFQLSQTQEI